MVESTVKILTSSRSLIVVPKFLIDREFINAQNSLGCGHRAIRNPQTALDFLRIAAILNRTIFSSFCNPLGPGPGGHKKQN